MNGFSLGLQLQDELLVLLRDLEFCHEIGCVVGSLGFGCDLEKVLGHDMVKERSVALKENDVQENDAVKETSSKFR